MIDSLLFNYPKQWAQLFPFHKMAGGGFKKVLTILYTEEHCINLKQKVTSWWLKELHDNKLQMSCCKYAHTQIPVQNVLLNTQQPTRCL